MNTLSKDSSSDEVKFKKNTVIYTERDQCNELYLVKEGKIRILKKSKDRLIPIMVVREREVLGEEDVFCGTNRNTSAIAVEDTVLIKISKDDVVSQIIKSPIWVKDLMKLISERLQSTENLLSEHSIADDKVEQANALDPAEEVKFKSLLDGYEQ